MFGHCPSRRNFFRGLLSALCAWPFLRRTATSGAEPDPGAAIAPIVEYPRCIATFSYDGSNRLVSVSTSDDDGTARCDATPARLSTYVYDGRGRLDRASPNV